MAPPPQPEAQSQEIHLEEPDTTVVVADVSVDVNVPRRTKKNTGSTPLNVPHERWTDVLLEKLYIWQVMYILFFYKKTNKLAFY